VYGEFGEFQSYHIFFSIFSKSKMKNCWFCLHKQQFFKKKKIFVDPILNFYYGKQKFVLKSVES
jgi:hypothetical protein